ncbi:MAG TPA: asparagine synthase-related protein [Candidatus Methylomirabilis sp.]|nr:asparagine synthase-related protein [Candidatus Methylomirabilis sp.]
MSGFAGIVSADGGTPDFRLLEHMAGRLAFRGPDTKRIWTSPGAGFCFTFLRTGPAPQSPEQPCTLDGRLWLIGDVRLDGREDLRRELKQAGDSVPAETTDEELVLKAWRLRGEACLADLLGDFAFALWDGGSRQLLCVRDLMGQRPFFYASSPDYFYFSNTLEALHLIPGISSALDEQFIGDFLLQDWCADASRTIYRDIRRLPSGHRLKYTGKEPHLRQCAELPVEEPLFLRHSQEYVERFRSLLEQAVGDRLPREPSAIFLSGGLDSTSIAAVATKLAAERQTTGTLRAYTVDSRPLFDDQEAILASSLAHHLGVEIRVASAGLFPPYDGWEEPTLRTPEPIHDPFLWLSHAQYRQISAVARVAFTGYGGDDVLIGQAWPYWVYLFRKRRFGTIGKAFCGYLIRHGRIPPLRGGFRARLRRWMRREDPLAEFPTWLEPNFENKHHLRERWLELQREPKTEHPLHPIAYAGLSSESLSSTLETEDAAWTGLPVESRAPLLDLRMLRFLLRVPPVPWCMEKHLLREATRGTLPEEIRLRPKTPLPIEPLDALIQRNLWNPLALPWPREALRAFVDCNKLRATLESARGFTLWAGLRPMSLGYWLDGVENGKWIRYSRGGECA